MLRISSTRLQGFTILELMAAIAVIGILLGIGVPAFNEITRNNRTASQTNELVTAMNLARSEAMKLGMPVSVCAAANQNQDQCADEAATDWRFGLIVFSDRTGAAGKIDGTDAIVQAFPAARGGLSITSNDIGYLRFSGNGARLHPAVGTDLVLDVKHSSCTGMNLREITVISTGRASLAKKACP